MDDSLSIKSSDSTTTSDEYEFVPLTINMTRALPCTKNEQPLLNIVGNGDLDHLQKCLGEILNEENISNNKMEINQRDGYCGKEELVELPGDSEESLEQLADIQQECTVFGCITYLGSAAVNAPKSKTEILRNMAILNEQSSDQAIKVSLSIPNFANGVVVLYDANNNSVMARYDVQRIMFYDRGSANSNENSCFAFTYWHGNSQESALFQCHVFRCDIPEAVGPVSLCFGKAFQKPFNNMTNSCLGSDQFSGAAGNGKSSSSVVFEVALEVKEDDGKGNFGVVPRDRNSFRLRTNVEKQICLSIQQLLTKCQQGLEIVRCFGVLVSSGWNVKNGDMRLLDMLSEGVKNEDDESQRVFSVTAKWDSKELTENANNDSMKFKLTVALDLVVKQIKDPVRLTIETQCKICTQTGIFWSFNKGQMFYQFILYLKEVPSRNGSSDVGYEVSNMDRSAVFSSAWSNFANLIKSTSTTSLEETTPTDEFSDTDEPMLSGTGDVSKEWTDRELGSWNELLPKWTDTNVRPKQLMKLVQQGIPEALRGMVWQQLANVDKDDELLNQYRILISKDCSAEIIIKKDIHRTFPAHDYFKEAGGVGQDTLFNISKAYAVYDNEIGYCQGLTFIAASLLLHMPEEQAFCVLVRLMYGYKLRNLYKDGFEILKMKLYQLDRLLEEKDLELWQHFRNMGVETHMFAHHWFLTLYTARFPLYFVFSILDVVLAQGLDTIFQMALSLLITFKEDLLKLDFENIVKYIQVTLPKRCRSHKLAREVIATACKIKLKKLKKYESDFFAMKSVRDVEQDNANNEVERIKKILAKADEEKRQLISELNQTKEALFLEMQKSEQESKRNANIISEYKQICQRLDQEQMKAKTSLTSLQKNIFECERCSSWVKESSVLTNGESSRNLNNNKEDVNVMTKIKELELELAQTKLALVEAECRNDDLTHQLSSANTELQAVRNQYPPWLHKTLSSIKEVTTNKRVMNTQNVTNKLLSMTKTESILN